MPPQKKGETMGEGKRQFLGALGVVALLGSAVFGLRALEQRSPSAPSGVPASLQAPSPDAAFAVPRALGPAHWTRQGPNQIQLQR